MRQGPLGVLLAVLVNAADGWSAAGGGVGPAAVVVADEGCQGAVALGAVGPDAAVGPFGVKRAEEALDLAVPAWRVERDQDVAGAEAGEGVAELVAGGVALRVVAHNRLDGAAALLAKPPGRAAQRGRDGVLVLRAVQLAVDQAGVVVYDGDHLDRAGPAGLVTLGALPGRPVPGPVELRQLERVDVQQGASLGPLIATAAVAVLAAAPARDAVTREHLPDRRAMPAGQELQLHRPVVGVLARGQDRCLRVGAQRPRTRPRYRRPGPQTRPRDPLSLRRLLPTTPPPMRRGDRNRTLSRRRSKRAPTLNQPNQLQTARQSELASTVFHVRPLLRSCQSSLTNSLRTGPDNLLNRSLRAWAAHLGASAAGETPIRSPRCL